MSRGVDRRIIEAEAFFKDRVHRWMIKDLRRAISAKTNYLTTLGCLVYTEVIGTFFPPLATEKGMSNKEKNFYRCFFRLTSTSHLRKLDKLIKKQTNKGLYQHLRHGAAHEYYPAITKLDRGRFVFIPVIVASEAVSHSSFTPPPMYLDEKGHFTIAVKNYIRELEKAANEFERRAFVQKNQKYRQSAKMGIDKILRKLDRVNP